MLKKIPSMQALRQEYATLAAEKKKLYAGYRRSKEDMAAWLTAKRNVDMILDAGERRPRNHDLEVS